MANIIWLAAWTKQGLIPGCPRRCSQMFHGWLGPQRTAYQHIHKIPTWNSSKIPSHQHTNESYPGAASNLKGSKKLQERSVSVFIQIIYRMFGLHTRVLNILNQNEAKRKLFKNITDIYHCRRKSVKHLVVAFLRDFICTVRTFFFICEAQFIDFWQFWPWIHNIHE